MAVASLVVMAATENGSVIATTEYNWCLTWKEDSSHEDKKSCTYYYIDCIKDENHLKKSGHVHILKSCYKEPR